MSTKNNPTTYDCYDKLAGDEPYFVLRAKDADAAVLVRTWADMHMRRVMQGTKPEEDIAQVREAIQCAKDMEAWLRRENKTDTAQAAAAGPPGDANTGEPA